MLIPSWTVERRTCQLNRSLTRPHRRLIGPRIHHGAHLLAGLDGKVVPGEREQEIVLPAGGNSLEHPFIWRHASQYNLLEPRPHRTPSLPSLDLKVDCEVAQALGPPLPPAAVRNQQLLLR